MFVPEVVTIPADNIQDKYFCLLTWVIVEEKQPVKFKTCNQVSFKSNI